MSADLFGFDAPPRSAGYAALRRENRRREVGRRAIFRNYKSAAHNAEGNCKHEASHALCILAFSGNIL